MPGFFPPCSIGSVTGPAALETMVRVRNQIVAPPLPCETTNPWPSHNRTQSKLWQAGTGSEETGKDTACPWVTHCPHAPRQSLTPSGNSQQGKTFCLCWLQEASKSEKCGPVKENPPGNIHSTRHSSQKSLGKLSYSRSHLQVDPLLPIETSGTMDPLPASKGELSLFPHLASETD